MPIKDDYPALEKEYRELELNKTLTNTARTEALASIRTRWGLSYERIIGILSDRVYMENLLSQFKAVKQIEALAMAK